MRGEKKLRALLAKMKERLSEVTTDYEGQIRSHFNKDGTADAELRISITKPADINSVLTEIEEQLTAPKGVWISVGFRYDVREGEPIYRRVGGMSQVQSHYRRGSRRQYAFAAAKKINKGLRKAGRLKATEILIRMHANLKDEKPKRK